LRRRALWVSLEYLANQRRHRSRRVPEACGRGDIGSPLEIFTPVLNAASCPVWGLFFCVKQQQEAEDMSDIAAMTEGLHYTEQENKNYRMKSKTFLPRWAVRCWMAPFGNPFLNDTTYCSPTPILSMVVGRRRFTSSYPAFK